jgi:protein gp37
LSAFYSQWKVVSGKSSLTPILRKQWGGVRKKSTGRHYRGRTFDEMPRAAAMS